jgi:transposase
MEPKTAQQQCTDFASVLYLAFELSSKKWKLGFTVGLGQKPRIRDIEAGDLSALMAEILSAKKRFKLPEACRVVSCYEAGRDGFYLGRFLTSEGIENLVVDSSSIEVNRPRRRAKADRLDVGSLLRLLIRHCQGEPKAWSLVRVPTVEEEDRRQLHRELGALEQEKNRIGNRIRGLLATQGISKAGLCPVRKIAIELAWMWLRYQPDSKLTRWYNDRFANGGKKARKVGIVAVARRLIIELWRFLETGALPEGAELKSGS